MTKRKSETTSKKVKEEWKVDNHGFVSHKDNFFHIRDIGYVGIHGDKLVIHLKVAGIGIQYSSPKDLSRMLKWFSVLMRKSEETMNKHHYEILNYQERVLKAQDKIVKTVKEAHK